MRDWVIIPGGTPAYLPRKKKWREGEADAFVRSIQMLKSIFVFPFWHALIHVHANGNAMYAQENILYTSPRPYSKTRSTEINIAFSALYSVLF
jgi:hypothetical protein